jgi:hypothetical protein
MKNTKKKVADQLLAVLGRLIDVGQDLNAITSSMHEALSKAAAGDARDLDHGADILDWACRMGNIGADVSGSIDDLMCVEEVLSHG